MRIIQWKAGRTRGRARVGQGYHLEGGAKLSGRWDLEGGSYGGRRGLIGWAGPERDIHREARRGPGKESIHWEWGLVADHTTEVGAE